LLVHATLGSAFLLSSTDNGIFDYSPNEIRSVGSVDSSRIHS
jgi:hypothetical protein